MAGAAKPDDEAQVAEAKEPFEESKWRTAYEAVLQRILADYQGQEAKVRDGMESGMRKLFEHPYHVELGLLERGKQSPLSLEEAQRVVFFPRPSDMRRYAAAFARDTSSVRREQLMKFKMLSVFYTLHRKDGTLVDRFIHYGGLESLVALVAEDNNIIQSQAVELLMEMLSPMVNTPAGTSTRPAHLSHQVFRCLTSAAFWSNLSKVVAEKHEVFPRSHSYCVRILAGAVGWLRPENPSAVPEAGPPRSMIETADALKSLLSDSVAAPDIRGLAEDLLEELLGSPRIREDPQTGEELAKADRTIFAPEAEAREDAAHAWQALRQLGNEAVGAGLLWPAEAAYRLAMQEGASAVPSTEASLIQSNRALVLLRAGHHREAAIAAADALEQNPRNVKAAYRRAQALLDADSKSGTEATRERVQTFKDALEAAELAAQLDPQDAKVVEVLARARKNVAELGEVEEAAEEASQDKLDSMD